MQIRELMSDDLEALDGLYRQFWGQPSCLPKMWATYQRLSMSPNYIFLVAEKNGHLAGSVMGIVCEELYGDCRPFMVIEDVIVDGDCRRDGIGSALMRELEERALKADCSYIIFVTETTRDEAHRFYASLGYETDAYKGFKKRLPPDQPGT